LRSIRQRLVLHTIMGTLGLFVTLMGVYIIQTQAAFRHQFDAALSDTIETFADLTEVVRGRGVVFRFDQLHLPQFEASASAAYYEVRARDGTVLTTSRSLQKQSLPRLEPGTGEPLFHDITLPDGRSGRAAALRFIARKADRNPPPDYDPENPAYELVMIMARSREPLDRARSVVLNGFLLFGFLLVCGTVVGVHRIVKHGLAPLEHLANALSAIQPGNLTWRFDLDTETRELTPVTSRLNELLDRLDGAFRRERRLTADIAHELRTPIAELRTLAELGLRNDESDEGIDYLRDVLEIASRMENCVDSLLALARCESGLLSPVLEDLDLIGLVRESLGPYGVTLEDKQIELELDLPDKAMVRSDRRLLLSILTNLFTNAATYTDFGGSVLCRAVPGKETLELTVVNTTSQLAPEDLETLFNPFWRKDPSRSGEEHVGLGLTLVQSYSELLRLPLRVDIKEPGHFEVSLLLPLSPATSSDTGAESYLLHTSP
jgi:signal transduction histidine kinase